MQRSRHGFSLVETLVALLLVSLAAMLLVRASAANAVALAQTIKHASAVRLASEFSAWTHRDGHLALGMPLDEAIAVSAARSAACYDGNCSAEQGAWHYLSRWRERLYADIPDARISVCVDDEPSSYGALWFCDSHGDAWVMKLGWPPQSDNVPAIVIELGPA